VFKIEELGELADELSNRCGQPVEIPRFNSSKSKLVITDLHPKTQDAVAQYVENEYKHLGAFYQNPFAV